jgi:tetratricopeptide (TPR) repeat protein
MKKTFLILFCLQLITVKVIGSIIYLKSGEAISTTDPIYRLGDVLQVKVDAGEIGYPVSNVTYIQFDTPPAFQQVTADIDKEMYRAAQPLIDVEMIRQTPFMEIPGNLWSQAAILKLYVFIGEKRTVEAKILLDKLTAHSKDPQILNDAKLIQILLSEPKDLNEELPELDEVIKKSTNPRTIVCALKQKGDIYYSDSDYDHAVLSYMNINVFYPDKDTLIPKAIMGCGLCFEKIKDFERAESYFQRIVTDFPDTPEKILAQNELVTINKHKHRT